MPCSTCRFVEVVVTYEDDDAPEDLGTPETICRRFPPMGDGWPVVLGDDWCGEFREAPLFASREVPSDGK